MEIQSIKQLADLKPPIDPHIIERSRKALEEGGRIRLFGSKQEVDADTSLTVEEKEFALGCFACGLSWAIVFNPKPEPPEPWFNPHAASGPSGWYDSHGNFHSSSGGSQDNFYH